MMTTLFHRSAASCWFAGKPLVWGLLLLVLFAPFARADKLDEIRQRGTLIVGVKKDVALWGFMDPQSGELKGLEPDLARLVAENLGVKLSLVGLLTSERTDAVLSGKVDMLIATLSDTPERQKSMTLVLPHYQASGVNLLARKSDAFKSWGELRNRRVCTRRGAAYNRPITVDYGVDLIALYGNAMSLASLRDGRCSAMLDIDISIVAMLQSPQWAQNFEMPLPTLYNVLWSIALAPTERAGALEKTVSKLVLGWHRDGVLQALERHWGIPSSVYLKNMHEAWSRKLGGKWFCGDEVTSGTPLECL
jgi:polar amino acid transport system substrate-binding protein